MLEQTWSSDVFIEAIEQVPPAHCMALPLLPEEVIVPALTLLPTLVELEHALNVNSYWSVGV